MCYVIITCRSLGWTLLSIAVTLMIVASVVSPYWLVRTPDPSVPVQVTLLDNSTKTSKPVGEFKPTIGIFNRCQKYNHLYSITDRETCANFVTDFMGENDDFPHAWKAAVIFFALAGLLLTFAMIMSAMSLFVRSMCGKSIFTLAGLVQSIGGLLCVIGLVIYPAGWGTTRVKRNCGEYADPYIIDRCSLGWSFYLCIIGTILTFACSVLSIQAEHSTSSRKVEEEVMEGKNLICVL